MNVGSDKRPFEFPVDLVLCGVAVWVGAGPAVVLNCGVKRLSGIAGIVTEPTGVEDGDLLNVVGVLVSFGEASILAQSCLQALPDLGCLPGLKADLIRSLSRGKDGGFEVEPAVRERSEGIGQLQIDEVFGSLHGEQFRFGKRAPAVGLRTEVFDLGNGSGPAKKSGCVLRQPERGQAIDDAMTFVTPGIRERCT